MKYFRLITIPVIALVIGITISCERDDICPESTQTTSSLIIDLYDADNPESKKNAFNLLVFGIDNENFLPGYGSVTEDQLILPLKTDDNTTTYVVHKDYSYDDNDTPDDTSDDIIGGNPDVITINYSRKDVYVSRACGYKTVFENITLNVEDDVDRWIISIEDLTDNQPIENENATHFNIYH